MASLAEKHNKEVKRLIEMSPDKRREYEEDIPFRVPELIPLADITLSELAEGLENTVYTSPKEFMKPRRSRRI
jgi:hypothetical protein